ncbi:uncharacterized protein LOC115547558 [Gadus morhua]|uniref:uncharacterized protein LOC115547558 n=1 Tax=Gadus morhua TaxID=8049 RepID=UPI0011B53529|nr:uncharacterized protein LOC115547558 [Gadus morhua]
MKQPHVIALLLCLLSSDDSLAKSPEIIGPVRTRTRARLGRTLVLTCMANPHGDSDLTVIYWLVNGSFPEALSTSRISEMDEPTSSNGTVQRNLKLKNVTTEDLCSTYVCVVMNPEGIAKKHVTLRTHRKKMRIKNHL